MYKIKEQTHKKAHKNYRENMKQVEQIYYWPQMRKKLKEYVRNCTICNSKKYDRNPHLVPIGEAPIPSKEGEFLHLDIF